MNPLTLLLAMLSLGAFSRLTSDNGPSTSEAILSKSNENDVESPKSTPPVSTPDEEEITPKLPELPGLSEESEGDGGGTVPLAHDGGVDVIAGRVATIAPEGDDVASVRILSGVDHGKVTVNPDNSMALVMTLSDYTDAERFTYEVTHSDGSTSTYEVDLNVVEGPQQAGWATGEYHYMLETDENDRVIVEHGDNHVKVHISGAEDALTLADIARLEGLSVSEVDGAWLAAHGGYGQSEGLALAEDAGMALWREVTPRHSETSNWLLFESGYE